MKVLACSLLLVLIATGISSAAYAAEEAVVPAATPDVRVVKIITIDGRMIVGEILSEKADQLQLLDLKSGKETVVKNQEVKVREDRLDPQEAIKWVGLPTYLAWRIKKESELNPKGKIVTVTPTTIYLNLGERDGLEKGDKVSVYREGETLKDPETGEVLGKVRARIGELEVTEVQEKFSKARRLSDLEIEFKAGDVAETVSTKKAVAVFPVIPAKDDHEELAMLMTERLTTELASHGVALVERELLDSVLVELGLQSTSLVDQEKAVKIGRLIGARSVLTGTLGSVEAGKVEVHARLIKVRTGEVVVAGSEVMRVEVPKRRDVQHAPPAAQPVSPLRVWAGFRTAAGMARQMTLNLGSGVTMELVLIPAGEFMMGSPEGVDRSDEHPQHRVRISRPFYMGVTEVTQQQYQAVMGTNPSSFKSPSNPAETMSWNDAMEFCRRMSRTVGMTVRLPTEAEWEYACRAGSTGRFYFGDSATDLGRYAWYSGNSGGKTHPVAGKRPNAWGLYDMLGNVTEWCRDWYGGDYYVSRPATDPEGPIGGKDRVLRGGCWRDSSSQNRSAVRLRFWPTGRAYVDGFRVVVSPKP